MTRRIVFRADADNKIGIGHLTRCISLSEILAKNFACVFVIRNNNDLVGKLLQKYTVIYLESSTLEQEIIELKRIVFPKDIFVTDGYQFNENYQIEIKKLVCKLVMIDDQADQYYYADLIINHGSVLSEKKYRKEKNTKVLAGFQYLLLRKEFLHSSKKLRTITKVDSVFICMGGADPYNITIKILKACMGVSFIEHIDIVVGGAYSNKSELFPLIENAKQFVDIKFYENISAKKIAQLIAANEISICPSSTISLEVASIQSGLLTGIVADNQDFVHLELLTQGCCISVGNFLSINENELVDKLESMHSAKKVNNIMANQYRMIDGGSANRLLTEFKSLVSC